MDQFEPELLDQDNPVDDWGDFSGLVNNLETQEKKEAEPEELTDEDDSFNGAAMAAFLGVFFTATETITSLVTGVDFKYDEKGKQEVTDAAVPVFEKHGAKFLGSFGDYMEEITLFIAVLTLAYTSRKSYLVQKKQHLKQLELERRAQDAKEVVTA